MQHSLREKKRKTPLRYGGYVMTLVALLGINSNSAFAGSLKVNHFALTLQTQTIPVSGKVTDDSGSPLPGVNILEKGTSNGTVSDTDGNYRLNVSSSDATLSFSFIGYVTQEVKAGSSSSVNIQLLTDSKTLSEVIVVGHGTQERKDVTGSVASVKSEDFNKGIINSPEQLLQGKVAGVNVTSASGEPGGNQSITVRGPGGVRTGSTPLF